ncbi:MAG: hypothetical protein D6679_10300 [Candidatus Hydrogenedentota bacterium]|nr:MAG: hypothetical protein D6679_10300 [Candidatus Hydrogenedentota bacterium]
MDSVKKRTFCVEILLFIFLTVCLVPPALRAAEAPSSESKSLSREELEGRVARLEEDLARLEADREAEASRDDDGDLPENPFRKIKWSGYFTFGYRNSSEPGVASTFDMEDVALIARSQVTRDFNFFSEFEFEHGTEIVAGGTSTGELKLEQAYVDWVHSDALNVRVGKFLMPMGIWHQNFWPPLQATVFSPLVYSSKILPHTQAGVQLYGAVFPEFGEVRYAGFVSNGEGTNPFQQDLNEGKAVGGRLSLTTRYLLLGAGWYHDRVAASGGSVPFDNHLGILYGTVRIPQRLELSAEDLLDLDAGGRSISGYVQALENLDRPGRYQLVQRADHIGDYLPASFFTADRNQWRYTFGGRIKISDGIRLKADYVIVDRTGLPDYHIGAASFTLIF